MSADRLSDLASAIESHRRIADLVVEYGSLCLTQGLGDTAAGTLASAVYGEILAEVRVALGLPSLDNDEPPRT